MVAGLDSLKFSINAYDGVQFEEVMGVKSKLFEKALENLKLAAYVRGGGEARWLSQWPRPKKYSTGLYASAIAYDGEQGKRMRALVKDRVLPYVDEFYLLPLYSMSTRATEREAELGYKPIAGNQGRLDNLREPLPCWTAFTEGHVRADGGLSACCFDAGGEWVMGDLTEEPFLEAWHSDRFQALRRAHLARDVTGTPCEECVAYA
jgi:radical SAM protein with 4Fe4S-binding SPASM domain